MPTTQQDTTTQNQEQIDTLVSSFFDLFTNTHGRKPPIHKIRDLFITEGLIINNTPSEPEIYNLDSFIEPREELLTNGTFTNFSEQEVHHKTVIHGKIAQRDVYYQKSGELNGESFKGSGHKCMHFIKINDRWLITAVIWNDESQ